MSVLVTGGAGYIGSHMALELLDAGASVVVIDNLSTGYRWAVPAGADLVVADIADTDVVMETIRKHKVDAIIHFAGSIVVPDSVADPLGYYLNNTVKSRGLIAAAVASNVKTFIFSSTAAVYGNPVENPVTETAALTPMSPYGSSKLMTEVMLADTARAHDFRFVALRYFNVAGADPKGRSGQSTPKATHLIKVASETALGKRAQMEVFGTDYPTPDGTCIRDYIQVNDLASAHLAALTYLRNGGASDIFNCGYSKGYSVDDVIAAVKRVSGVDFKVVRSPRRAGDPAAIVAASNKLRATLGWRPKHEDLDGIVGQALAWERRVDQLKGTSLTA
ncbi:UDP-glucose 4-epimerase GalE [Hyphomicrobium methylovorum]|uniref:UDP-glucose 4-epimerase GalE n=1 Tax=Hyphomicrobium methylovorum TaxID=84 RepID=UPI0015E63A5C|nr:UDP-glucose 4-epimerase GalE [Hyphomicrobium methylovorum]MBA2126796.1 UDP-glucose 4-epimerase GalE [Hyphomicrobium methylovorum]